MLRKLTLDKSVYQHDGFVPIRIHLKKLYTNQRLVARGFEEVNKEDIPKDPPICGSDSLRLVLTVMAQRNWNVYTMDIKTAFLQGSEIEREIFLKPI